MRNKIQFLFILNLIFKISTTCLLEYNECIYLNGTYYSDSCCLPFICEKNNTRQCLYEPGIESTCIERYSGCENETIPCCTGLTCQKTQNTVNAFQQCQVLIVDPNEAICVVERNQCGGFTNILGQVWNGQTDCCPGLICNKISIYYSQCVKEVI